MECHADKSEEPAEPAVAPAEEPVPAAEEAEPVPAGPTEQEIFNTALRCACELMTPESVMQYATPGVTSLTLTSALPHTISLSALLTKLTNLQVFILLLMKNVFNLTGKCPPTGYQRQNRR